MPISFTCPHCGTKTDVAEQYAGQTGPCVACGKTVTVPPLDGMPGYSSPAENNYGTNVVVTLALIFVAAAICCAGGFFFVSARVGRNMPVPLAPTPISSQCANNLKRIAAAMQAYHDDYGSFPPAYVADENGTPMHSWRVLLLPYLGEDTSYDQYKFDEPWDSENNRQLLAITPSVYQCPEEGGLETSTTNYLMLAGPGAFADGEKGTSLDDIPDGPSMTMMIVETTDSGIEWTRPRDMDVDKMTYIIDDRSSEGICSWHGEGCYVLFCDGTVRVFNDLVSPNDIRAMITRDGGEFVDPAAPR